ncbi:MAG TPA: MFS transporter [Verrucomicrobiae bacterium]|nr:MFS transporter [Verrucomicrobiae bacterium]
MAESKSTHLVSHTGRIKYPRGFRPRRGLNWFSLGLMYASFYVCRYNFRFATPGLVDEYGFDKFQITGILGAWSMAYGFGQLINGLITDRIGGKRAMLIGATATIVLNLLFGFASFYGTFSTFALIWLMNGYFQSYGAPGMIKINAAWFNRTERGTFAGIFGFMIQLGQVMIGALAPIILAGFTIGTWTVAKGDWRWMFRIPPIITALCAINMAINAKHTPEEAGWPGLIHDEVDSSAGVTIGILECFKRVFTNPLIWFYAVAYACTGAVRSSSDQLAVLFFDQVLKLRMENKPFAEIFTVTYAVPMVAVIGSLVSGIISDRFFKGHRSPVAMALYFMQAVLIGLAALVFYSGAIRPTGMGVFLGCLALILISLMVNSTHSLVGAAAPMDIGGRKMSGFASGVIDSFQYFGMTIFLPATGWLIDHYGWGVWFPTMAMFGIIGGVAMLLVMRKQRRLGHFDNQEPDKAVVAAGLPRSSAPR